jgi:hypothetical protein
MAIIGEPSPGSLKATSSPPMPLPGSSAAPMRAARPSLSTVIKKLRHSSRRNKPVLLALAQALIDHPKRTLNGKEIDAVIAQTLAREALAAEQARRAAWRRTCENSENFTT